MALLRLTDHRGETAVLVVSGDLDSDVAEELHAVTAQLICRRHPNLRISLARVRSIDRNACVALVAARQRAELLGGRLRLVRAPHAVRDALRVLGAGQLVELLE
jgi:anti-anti-sigma factor